MTDDRLDSEDDFHDLERLLLSAGDFVELSPDLRADTLEDARLAHAEGRVQRRLATMAFAFLMWSTLAQPPDSPSPVFGRDAAADLWQSVKGSDTVELQAGWGFVEAYQRLREKQTRVLTNNSF